MPRGRKAVNDVVVHNDNASDIVTTLSGEIIIAGANAVGAGNIVNKKLTPVEESRKVLNIPLQAGQAFFESPEGFIEVGEKSRNKVWCRPANDGKGMWINPMR